VCKLPKFEYRMQEDFELFNVPTRGILEEILIQEAEKMIVQNNRPNRVVYEQEAPSPFLAVAVPHQKINGSSKSDPSLPYYVPDSLDDTTLIFESRFESGNLAKAVQV